MRELGSRYGGFGFFASPYHVLTFFDLHFWTAIVLGGFFNGLLTYRS